MKQLIFLTILSIACYCSANAQTVEIEKVTAEKCAKCFLEAPARLELIESLKSEIKAKDGELRAKEGELAARIVIINLLEKENELLRKLKCPTVSIFWGVYKRKTCY